MRQPDDIAEVLANGDDFQDVDPVGTNYEKARLQAYAILDHWNHQMIPVLTALITKIQEQQKSIEMFEYNQKWRKRRP